MKKPFLPFIKLLYKFKYYINAAIRKIFIKFLPASYSFDRNIDENTYVLASYPKSGNTWVRFIFANLMYPALEINLGNIENLVPSTYAVTGGKLKKIVKRNYKKNLKTIVKTHSSLKAPYLNTKTVYLIRDPRDVCISFYHHKKRSNKNNNLTFKTFFFDFTYNFHPEFGRWDMNVSSYINYNEVLTIKYEDLKQNTYTTVKKMVDYFGFIYTKNEILNAINKSSFESLQKMEKQNLENKQPFFRSGKSKQFLKNMTHSQISKIETSFEQTMKNVQYEKFRISK